MNEIKVTICGWVATEPSQHVGPSGARLTSFRVATTSRFYDREAGAWQDGRTEWVTCKIYRAASITVANSIHKGQPVLVYGRFRTAEWETDGGTRTDLVIDVEAIGHDLAKGTAEFTRAFGDAALVPSDEDADHDTEEPSAA